MGKIPRNKEKPVAHQFQMFPWTPPSGKVPISKARIEEAKKQYFSGNKREAILQMRAVNDALENYNRRLFNGKKKDVD